MAEEQNKPNFWTTLPGILTGLAALLTALGGLFLALHQSASNVSPKDQATPPTIAPQSTEAIRRAQPSTPSSAPATSVTSAHDSQPVHKGNAVITENDGSTVTLDDDSLTWLGGKEITFKSGQSIPFNKIQSIKVVDVDETTTSLQVILTNGQTLNESVDGGKTDFGTHFVGKNEVGPVSIRIGIVNQVVFEH